MMPPLESIVSGRGGRVGKAPGRDTAPPFITRAMRRA